MEDSNIMNDSIKRKDAEALIERFKGYIDVDMIYSICNIKIRAIPADKANYCLNCGSKMNEEKDHEAQSNKSR